ncbi:MAG TPA: GGDEF domain-containing protein [Solirubrobacteraceae bacterium]|jgi:diguanylate cyclase (GGDEF)-like protein|nr:GGDEF domain-containing protein [Solirubrobacteraceae bacterium]
MGTAYANGPANDLDLAPVLAGVRRLTLLADSAEDAETVYAALARELIAVMGAEEVHVHHLTPPGEDELVVVHMLGGDGRLSYVQPFEEERPPGVSWVASTGRSFLAVGPRELTASVPRLSLTAPPIGGSQGCALLTPLALAGQVEAVVVLVRRESAPYDERSIEEAATLVDQAATVLALVLARAEAGTDSVAGCLNHRAMRRRLHEEIGRAERTGGQLSCVIVDLDDFKLVNDRYGHQAGDSILRQVAQALTGEFRAFDRVARYGGDEFVVILPNAGIESAVAAAGRALERMRRVLFPDGSRGVSASMGVAQWQTGMTEQDLLQVCDAALLQGKRDGKGSVTGAISR